MSTSIQTRIPLYLTAGVTAGFIVGGNTYTNVVTPSNSSLAGWDFTLEIRGFGTLYPGSDFTFDGTNTITITLAGYTVIAPNEKWIIAFQPKIVDTPAPTPPTQADYSNGYKIADVLPALMNRRRWRQPTRTDFPFTLTGNNVWESGDIYSPVFEAIHKIVSPYNIWQVQEDKDVTDFNTTLQNLQTDVILKCLASVFNKKEFLEKKLMFERFGRQDYVNANTGLFTCVRILPAKAFNVSVQIDNVALKFDSNVTFNLYLFHDSQPTIPLKTISVTASANAQTVVNIGQVLSYSGHGNKSGVYYLGYFQDDLGSAQAINEIVQNFNPMFNFGCVPIELKKTGGTAVDVNQVSFTVKTHGFNIQLSAFRDYTQLIVDNAYLFDNLIGLQMAADVIEMIQNNTRTNKDQRITQELTKMLYSDLNHAGPTEESPFAAGLKSKITNEVYRVKHEFFPKKKVTSITHDTQSCNIYGTPAPLLDVFNY